MKNFDFIIVGSGLSGSSLAYFLSKNRKKILIIDDSQPNSASRIAAGIIHPITGRRIVKTWNADALIPFTENYYREIEKISGQKFFNPMPVLEIFSSVKNRNDWHARSADDSYRKYFDKELSNVEIEKYLNAPWGGVLLHHSAYLDVAEYLSAIKNVIENEPEFVNEKFLPEDLDVKSNGVTWKDVKAGKIIFCEGSRAVHNPFFKRIPFLPAKGEMLLFRSKNLPNDYIINQSMSVLPVGNNYFKAGATFEWGFKDELPTEAGRNKIKSFLKKILKADFEITGHYAAVRPTIQNRKPVIGLHPENNNIGILNGIGTKGVLLAPYFASRLAEFLAEGKSIMPKVDMKRFFTSG